MPDVLCPSCKIQIEPGAAKCAACGHALTGPDGRWTIATRRNTDGEILHAALDTPGTGPQVPGTGPGERCEGCDPTFIQIVDGQAVALTLTDCDAELCYFTGPPTGIA
jgi:hypothetical protein